MQLTTNIKRQFHLLLACLVFAAGIHAPGVVHAQSVGATPPKWGYKGNIGPARWGSISEGFKLCADGLQQSPIDLIGADDVSIEPMAVHYQPFPMIMVNNGNSIQVKGSGFNFIKLGMKQFDLKQFHFHTPSEHSLGGFHYAMEIHFVNQAFDGQLVVVGVFIMEGVENKTLKSIWQHLSMQVGPEQSFAGINIDPNDLIPAASQAFNYLGSLTTPPCTEGVTWYVLSEPITASMEQIAEFRSIVGLKARPTQAYNCRTVHEFPFVKNGGKLW